MLNRMLMVGAVALTLAFGATTAQAEAFCVKSGSVALLAGQHIDAGEVSAIVVDGVLKVKITTTGGWELIEAHLWVGTSPDDYPQAGKSTNPVPGQFPMKSGQIVGHTTWEFTVVDIPIGVIDCENSQVLYAMAHASVRKLKGDGSYQTETGWGDGPRVQAKGNWATRFPIEIGCCVVEGGTEIATCDSSAYAKGDNAICFRDINKTTGEENPRVDPNVNYNSVNFSKSGWTNRIIGDDLVVLELWAGTDKCDTGSPAELVGTVEVERTGGIVYVTYLIDTATHPYVFVQEAHLYVGTDLLHAEVKKDTTTFTLAPGQFPHSELPSFEVPLVPAQRVDFEVPDPDTDTNTIYVVAHAKVGPLTGVICELTEEDEDED